MSKPEAEFLVMGHEVERITGKAGRWLAPVASLCEYEGRQYVVCWLKGLTECQEDEFYNDTVNEVTGVTVDEVVSRKEVTRYRGATGRVLFTKEVPK